MLGSHLRSGVEHGRGSQAGGRSEMLIRCADGTSRYFISRSRLRQVLDLPTEQQYQAALQLLQEEEYLTPHRRSRSPAHGLLLPPEWSSEHVGHLPRIARNL